MTTGSPAARGPALSQRARSVVDRGRTGALATLSARHSGQPFASLMPFAADASGRPLFLISGLAVHTGNLEADPRASLLVAEPEASSEDPLAAPRVTLMGSARRLPSEETDEGRALYLGRHPEAARWVDLGDFAFWRLEVAEVYVVEGFGVMGWVSAAEYAGARPTGAEGVRE